MKLAEQDQRPLSRLNDTVDAGWTRLASRMPMAGGARRMLVLVVVAFASFAALKPAVFLSVTNLQNIAVATPEIGVIAVAMMLAMLTGGIDLSLVSTANLSAITMSTLFTAISANDPGQAERMVPVIVLAGLGVGLLGGLVNGLLVAGLGITPILATLGTMQIYNGIAVAWTGGETLYGAPSSLTALGLSTVGGIPTLFILFVAVAIAIGVLVSRTPLGLRIQLQGANPTAARYSGIASRAILLRTYTLTGLLGGIAGVLFLARNPTASADYGASYVLLVIVIAVLGGTNPSGGAATVFGVVLATLTLQIVSSGFTAMRLSAYEYAIAQGVILVAVMAFDSVRQRRRRRRRRPWRTALRRGSPDSSRPGTP
ncbi:ABC transporter permease [Streptomyces sp. NPDC046805]|uniref:ABC transporter permease n=1 Tax=Streptomyces sp. NPDC046805 TaxID=3155134 RepID=UPI0033FE3527